MGRQSAVTSRFDGWIRQSARQTETIHLGIDERVTEEELAVLIIECEDSCWIPGESQYWGTTEDGAEWRIHVAAD